MEQLTDHEAYLAMFAFLEAYYSNTKSEDVGGLLGAMSLLPDGKPADVAIAADWAKAIATAKAGNVSAALRLRY